MITVYFTQNNQIKHSKLTNSSSFPENTKWIDIFSPTQEEEAHIEKILGLNIPTREEMSALEISNRLYLESNALFMTINLVTHFSIKRPEIHPFTFVVMQNYLITIRYVEATPFTLFSQMIEKGEIGIDNGANPISLLMHLKEKIIARLADMLELVGHNIDQITHKIFSNSSCGIHNHSNNFGHHPNYQKVLNTIGLEGDLLLKIHDSLTGMKRMMAFLQQQEFKTEEKKVEAGLSIFIQDIGALRDHAEFLSNKITFLLDATLGLVSIEQNNIIKFLSLAAVVFLPPTLIVGIYGMNFRFMPELAWEYGYPVALILLVLSGIVPYFYFIRKRDY